jgi:pimeloyl-ACP methyl ester carboxylesterase
MESSDIRHGLVQTAAHVEIEYVVAGRRHDEAVVFVPGLGANLQQYHAQVAHFSKQYCAVAISLRGHGKSTCPSASTEADFAFDKLATDVQLVLDHLEIDTAHIVGNSTGGIVGYQLIKQVPQRVRSLTTFGTVAELHMGLVGRGVVLVDRLLGPRGAAWLVQRAVSEDKSVANVFADMVRTTDKPALVNLRKNLIDYDYLPTLEQHPNIPILLIQGEQDRDINRMLGTTLLLLQQRVNAQVVPIKHAGHITNPDQPTAFNRTLSDFLQAQ